MIRIKIQRQENLIKEINLLGHALYDDYGKDIVCAGVSSLVQTLLVSIDSLAEDKIKYEISPGRADIYYGNLSEKSRTLVDSFFIGVGLIADDFPDTVRIM